METISTRSQKANARLEGYWIISNLKRAGCNAQMSWRSKLRRCYLFLIHKSILCNSFITNVSWAWLLQDSSLLVMPLGLRGFIAHCVVLDIIWNNFFSLLHCTHLGSLCWLGIVFEHGFKLNWRIVTPSDTLIIIVPLRNSAKLPAIHPDWQKTQLFLAVL